MLGLHAVKHLGQCRGLGRYHHVDADMFEKFVVLDVADSGDDSFSTKLFDQKGTQEIFFVIIGSADTGVGSSNASLLSSSRSVFMQADGLRSIGDKELASPGNAGNEDIFGKPAFFYNSVDDCRTFLDPILKKFGLTACEKFHVKGFRNGNNPEDILGEKLFRPYDRINVVAGLIMVVSEGREIFIEGCFADETDRFGIGDFFYCPASDNIGLIKLPSRR